MDLQGRVPLGVSWRTSCQSPLLASAPVTTFGTSEALQGIYSTGLVYTYNITSPTVTLQPTNLLRELSYFECEAGFRPRRHPWRCAELIKIANTRHVLSVHNARGSALHLKRMRRINAREEVEAGSVKWKCEMEVRSRSAQ